MTKFESVQVVGMHFRPEGKATVAMMEEGHEVTLQREPENQYDENAIKVFFEDTHIGYVNREDAIWVAPVLDDEPESIQCVVVKFVEENRNRYPFIDITCE